MDSNWIDILISIVLALIMFTIGSRLEWSDFSEVLKKPKALIIGLILQLLALPLFTFACVYSLDIDPLYKLGFMIVSFCPGGTTSNFISYLVKANVSLSVSLTLINSFIVAVTIPLFTSYASQLFIGASARVEMPFFQMMTSILFVVVAPLLLGLFFNKKANQLAERIEPVLKYLNIVLLAVVFAVKFFANKNSGGSGLSSEAVLLLLPIGLFIQISSMLLSWFGTQVVFRVGKTALTIGIEVGLQNTTLALLISSVLLANDEMAFPALVIASFSFFTTVLFALIVNYFSAEKQ